MGRTKVVHVHGASTNVGHTLRRHHPSLGLHRHRHCQTSQSLNHCQARLVAFDVFDLTFDEYKSHHHPPNNHNCEYENENENERERERERERDRHTSSSIGIPKVLLLLVEAGV